MKKYFPFLVIAIGIGVLFLVILIFLNDYSDKFPSYKTSEVTPAPLQIDFRKLNSENIKTDFPYDQYLKSSGRFPSYNSVASLLDVLDTINSERTTLNRKVVANALSEKKEATLGAAFSKYKPDSLYLLMQWAIDLNAHSGYNPENEMMCSVLYDYWMNFTANKLHHFVHENYMLKYNFKFRYLMAECETRNYGVNTGYTNYEKGILHLLDSNWAYLLNRMWIGTSATFKFIGLILLLITLYAYFRAIQFHIRKKSKRATFSNS